MDRHGSLTENTVLTHLQSRLSDLLLMDTIPADMDLIASGALNSLMFLTILVELEDEFQIQVTGSDMSLHNFRTPSLIARFVYGKCLEG